MQPQAENQPDSPPQTDQQPEFQIEALPTPRKKLKLAVLGILIFAMAGIVAFYFMQSDTAQNANEQQVETGQQQEAVAEEDELPGLHLDSDKDYGNKYADGILPVGDDKYVTDGAKKGYIYTCSADYVEGSAAGATSRGPWFIGTTKWNINKKIAVQGSVKWTQSMSNK